MGPGAFLVGLLGAGAIFLLAAISAAASIAFFLPRRSARTLRSILEWGVGLSGAGYVAVILAWQLVISNPPHGQPVVVNGLLGVTVAASYLPLCILLLLRAMEPQWAALPASRSLGLSLWPAALGSLKAASSHLKDALLLYGARLVADGAAFALIYGIINAKTALVIHLIAMFVFGRHLSSLVQRTGVPVNPPFFGPLPEAPPRLGLRLRRNVGWRLAGHLSLGLLVVVAALQFSGLSILRSWAAAGNSIPSTEAVSLATPSLSAAIQSPLPLLAVAALIAGPWLALRRPEPPASILPLSLAGISPVLASFPAIAFFHRGSGLWVPMAAISLALYIIVQEGAARRATALAAVSALRPGEASIPGAARSLGLPLTSPLGPAPTLSQALSSAAAWFGAAALLAVLSRLGSPLPAAYALVWGLMAGFLQLVAVAISNAQPRPIIATHTLDIGQEAVNHDIT